MNNTGRIVTLNAGSSSIKFALFDQRAGRPLAHARGLAETVGTGRHLRITLADGAVAREQSWTSDAPFHADALARLLAWHGDDAAVAAVGHRVVHGGIAHTGPALVDAALIDELTALAPLAPLHQPHNLAAITAAAEIWPDVPQIACFDTSFHRHHPWVNDTFALPRALYEQGVRRYGFHGLSYEYITTRLADLVPSLAKTRVVIAHLGNGASMCAIRDAASLASSMGFTALDGLPMGTRCGQLDPGVVLYLLQHRGMSADAITDLLYRRSGLLGLSGLSSDMRELLASAAPHAAEAIEYFVFRIRRELGGLAAALEGLDLVVFCGGIGENAWQIRERVLAGMGWLGIELDPTANRAGAQTISTPGSAVRAMVIPTDEDAMIAAHCMAMLASHAAVQGPGRTRPMRD